MPDGWKAKAPADLDNGVYLDGPDNVQIQITDADLRGTRYEITGRPSREESRHSSHELDRKEFRVGREGITASAAKTPAQIAGDITRRLLPAYLPYLAALRARLVADNAHDNRVDTYREALLAAMGAAGTADGDEGVRLRIEDGYGSFEVQGDGGVYFRRLSVPRGLALEIAKAMSKYARTNGTQDD
jgi:hypothetical protein